MPFYVFLKFNKQSSPSSLTGQSEKHRIKRGFRRFFVKDLSIIDFTILILYTNLYAYLQEEKIYVKYSRSR